MILQIKRLNLQKENSAVKNRSIINDVLFFAFAIIVIALITLPGNIGKNEERKIVGVNIKGEVRAPGYYELEYGSRVKDAIIAAGSETRQADLTSINLALRLSDGEEIIIPKAGTNLEIQNSLININTADMYKLCKLDGVGETLATNIINYRSEKGEFKSVSDLKNVKGIGSSKFNKIKDKITVE